MDERHDHEQLSYTSFFFLIFSFQRNCRYDGQIAVFGSKLQELLGKQRYFLVSGLVRASVSMFRTCVAVTVLPRWVFFLPTVVINLY